MSEAAWIAVDWGTSNLRAWGIGADGEMRFAVSSGDGMSKLAPEGYPGALTALVADRIGEHGPPLDVLICGMAGARQGWREAPYVEVPADLGALASGAIMPPMPEGRLRPRILPGICQRETGAEEVMRGEETQLLGLASLSPGFAGTVCMPGTHAKWVRLADRHVERFATAMTGEMFELLRAHSVLRHSLDGDLHGAARDEGFAHGLALGLDAPGRLLSQLFKVRTAALLSGRTPDWCAGYLSGLLIGSEIGGARSWIGRETVAVVGDETLSALYAAGIEAAGGQARIVDGTEAVLAGLAAARTQIPGR